MKILGIKRGLLIAVAAALCLSCGGSNYLMPMSIQNSDEALYQAALKLVDKQDYDGALDKIASMTSNGQSRQDVILTKSGCYAGKCGLNFFSFASNLGGGGAPFAMFMAGFVGLTVNVNHCQTAQSLIEGNFGTTGIARLGSLGSRIGNNVNTFMAVLGMSKIGTQLKGIADLDNDGVADPAFNACTMTQAQIAQVGTGFALVLDNLTAIISNLSGGNAALLANLSVACAAAPGGTNPCTITDYNDPTWTGGTAAQISVQTAIQSLTKASTVGIGACIGTPFYPFDCCP